MTKVNMLQAKTHLSKLVEQIERGQVEEIVLARDGKPVARIVPLAPAPDVSRRLGLAEGQYPDMTLEDFDALNPEIERLFGIRD
jgi:antitoxin (DNA-binding transcriptional repressor) of toxin-antitoxin stability system